MNMIYEVAKARDLVANGFKLEVRDGLPYLVKGKKVFRLYKNVVPFLSQAA